MDIRKLPGTNKNIKNIFRIPTPRYQVSDLVSETNTKNCVIFFGYDMTYNLLYGGNDNLYIAKTNECLDYVRKNFKGYNLCYKPHPEENKEMALLNLRGFRIIDEKITAELFLWENFNRIKAVFSVCSTSSASAYGMGLNSYAFLKCYSNIFLAEQILDFSGIYTGMPESFFINDLGQELIINERALKNDDILEVNLKKVLSGHAGKIWFICSFAGSIDTLVILSRLIRDLAPDRKTGIVINRSHRWDVLDADYLKNYFDEIIFFPRMFYSLRPRRLWKSIMLTRQIKNFKISPDDILIVATFPEFVENCFISYHRKNFKIGFIASTYFNGQYDIWNTDLNKVEDFKFNKATWFYNKIFEPILGLYRTIYISLNRNGQYTNRYQKPINEIYDELYIIDVAG